MPLLLQAPLYDEVKKLVGTRVKLQYPDNKEISRGYLFWHASNLWSVEVKQFFELENVKSVRNNVISVSKYGVVK